MSVFGRVGGIWISVDIEEGNFIRDVIIKGIELEKYYVYWGNLRD